MSALGPQAKTKAISASLSAGLFLLIWIILRSGEVDPREITSHAPSPPLAVQPEPHLAKAPQQPMLLQARTNHPARLVSAPHPFNARLSGSLVNQAGEPLAGVQIGAFPLPRGWGDQAFYGAVSSQTGSFEIRDLLPHREYRVAFAADGYQLSTMKVQAQPHLSVTLAPCIRTRGRVLDADTGLPLEGARVHFMPTRITSHLNYTRWLERNTARDPVPTDKSGGFEITGMRQDMPANMHIDLEGYEPLGVFFKRAPLGVEPTFLLKPQGDSPADFEFVDWETGDAVSSITLEGQALNSRDLLRRSMDGSFYNRGLKASTWLRFSAPGYCTTYVHVESARRDGAIPRIRLLRAKSLELTVLDPAGGPVPYAQVTARLRNPEPGSLGLPPWQTIRSKPPADGAFQADGAGRIKMSHWAPGSMSMVLRASYGNLRCENPIVLDQQQLKLALPVEIRLSYGSSIYGRVALEGEPQQAQIYAYLRGKFKHHVATNVEGEYRLRALAPGAWQLRFVKPSTMDWSSRAPQTEARSIGECEVLTWDHELFPNGGQWMTGRILFANQQPAPRATAVLWAGPSMPSSVFELTLNTRGEFRVRVPQDPSTQWNLKGTNGNSKASLSKLRAPSKSLLLELPTLGSLSVQLVDASTLLPLELEHLWWRTPGQRKWASIQGIETLDQHVQRMQLPVGAIELLARPKSSKYPAPAPSAAFVREASATFHQFQLWEGITLQLHFVYEDGEPVSNLQDLPRILHSEHGEVPEQSMHHQAEGTFEYLALQDGEIQIAGDACFEFAPKTFALGSERVQRREVTIKILDQEAYRKRALRIQKEAEILESYEQCFDD